ncbi:melibiose:sodium transporter MelB [Vibrio alfacsensis]|uniref:melibiose:sodium transporter MelB n=1 Tax=Vibrio alfacsensis TaxID=1074311 RepID=UPI002ADE1D60|nr:melibiose:sodium transporter MelB [Vibrio alfacsensis]WQE78062.1 melibiose:sodium transporter MelB [Vibrio alfacsensis]
MGTTTNNQKVSMRTKLSFGIGGFGKDWGLNMINIFLMIYYTDVVGVSPVFIGTVFLFARIWDTINDPMLGYIVARTNSRWGKFKPWILVGNILNAVCIIALFSAHLFEGTTQLVFIAVTYVAWGMTYTLLDAPFWSLVPTITLDKQEREGLMPYPRLFATGASYMVGAIGVFAINFLGNGDQATGYLLFGVVAAVLAMFSAAVACAWTEQKVEEKAEATAMFSLKTAKDIIFKNDQFLMLVAIGLCYNIAMNFVNGLNLYFFKYALGNESLFSVSMLWAGLFGVLSLVFFKPLIKNLGRENLFKGALLAPAISAIVLFVTANYAPNSAVLVGVAGVFNGLSNAIYWLLILVMVADSVDYGDAKMGFRSESILYSMNTLVSKCSGAIVGFLVGIALTFIGYVPNEVQTADTIAGLQFIYFAPTLLCLVAFFIYKKFYNLNGEQLDNIQIQLQSKYA